MPEEAQGMPKRPAKKPATTAAKPAGRSRASDDRLAHLQRLIEVMVQKDVVEVELEEAGTRWRVRRQEPQAVAFAAPAGLPVAPVTVAGGQATATAGPGPAPAPAAEVFKSPMLGTFYRAPSPEAEPFVRSGDRVGPDTTLCIIEAMKVMNEIKAEREFEVVDVLVKNGDPVEFGQPLFLIR
jgi:acetyl-CoA carboxylase biotin carboxyl carrier protein